MTLRTMLAAVALFALAGTSLAAEAVIRGQATPADGTALKPGATLEVELLDTSRADAPAETRARASVPVKRVGPIPFVLRYDPKAIDAEMTYTVSARLVQGGQIVQRTDTATPVLTRGAGTTAKLALVALAEPEAAGTPGAADLAGDWTLAEIGGAPAAAGVGTTLTLGDAAEATGSGGCNSFHGSYSLDGETFRFGAIAATRRACPGPQMEQEARFLAALDATRGFRVESDRLLLLGETGDVLATLERG